MHVYIKTDFIYVPKWNRNKELKEKDQVKIHFKFLSGANLFDLLNEDGKIDKVKDWLSVCMKVENLNVNDKAITPQDLLEMDGLAELYTECKLAYKKESVISKKKLK